MGKDDVTTSHVFVSGGSIGNLQEYHVGDDWNIYIERLEQYYEANFIEEDRKVAVLLTMVGSEAYKTLRNLCDPVLPKERKYKELKELLEKQFAPRISVFRYRIKFDKLQQEGESINDWYVKVKNFAMKCQFGTMLEERVKDKFVTGMKQGAVLDRLCEEQPSKSSRELLEVALNKEAAARHTIEINKVDRGNRSSPRRTGPWKWQPEDKQNSRDRQGKESEVQQGRTKIVKEKEAYRGGEEKTCNCCGKTKHDFKNCRYKTYKCRVCKKVGHLANVCKLNLNNFVEQEIEHFPLFNVDAIDQNYIKPFSVKAKIEGEMVEMEVDTGAGLSCMPESLYKQKFAGIQLKPTAIRLKTYNGQIINPSGQIEVKIEINKQVKVCTILVVEQGCRLLLGRDLIDMFNLQIGHNIEINKIDTIANKLKGIIERYKELFDNELGKYLGEKVKLETVGNVKPIFHKPKPIPYAYREKVEKELDRLERSGVIVKISDSPWGTPLVPVVKADGNIRLCANYKITINKYLKDFQYPLPRIEDIFTKLEGGQSFTKLDFVNAYNQLEVDEETSVLLAWSTHKGIYLLKRLPFGTKPACSIFQLIVERILQGVKGAVNFLDDIVVTGDTEEEHLRNLEEVLKRLKEAGFKLNLKKCQFFEKSISYLGHIIDKDGLRKDENKVKAMIETPKPKNVDQIRAFVGMINYYSKFVPKLAQILRPLYDLLKKGKNFYWNAQCEIAFNKAKEEVASDRVLVHYNPDKPLRLACDASQAGIGAVLMHVEEDGIEKPISFVSRVLSNAEKNYSMIHKEALAIYWAVKKFYQYLAGRRFELCSDHKPLKALFGENKSLPQMAAGRLQRWALFLSSFNYKFIYIKGIDNVKADGLSRLPIPIESEEEIESDFNNIDFIDSSMIIDTNLIRSETRKDRELGKIFNYIRYGFPSETNENLLKSYFSRKEEMTLEKGVILWGYRIVIPKKCREILLKSLHNTHTGVVKMKQTARSYFWWPGLDRDIEDWVKRCDVCMSVRSEPPKAKLQTWETAKFVYDRIHADFAGPIQGKMLLIITDVFSKWSEVFIMNNNTEAKTTIEKFRECFARFGLPNKLVTDNGSQLMSSEFLQFCSLNNIHYVTSPPFHPATNGAAENCVKSIKNGIKKALNDPVNKGVSLETIINRYLFNYRNSIHCSTGFSPAEMIFKYKVKTRFDILRINDRQEKANENNVKYYKGNREVYFKEGDVVWCRDYRHPNKKQWKKCVVDEVLGPKVYLCKVLQENLIWKRHINQMVKGFNETDDRDEPGETLNNEKTEALVNSDENVNNSYSKESVNSKENDSDLDIRNLFDGNSPVVDAVAQSQESATNIVNENAHSRSNDSNHTGHSMVLRNRDTLKCPSRYT